MNSPETQAQIRASAADILRAAHAPGADIAALTDVFGRNLPQWSTMNEQHEKLRQKQHDAKERAEALLFSYLTPEQMKTWKKYAHFDKVLHGTVFRFHRYKTINIYALSNDKSCVTAAFCITPDNVREIPTEDVVLAQMLFLEADPQEFFRLANVFPVQTPLPENYTVTQLADGTGFGQNITVQYTLR